MCRPVEYETILQQPNFCMLYESKEILIHDNEVLGRYEAAAVVECMDGVRSVVKDNLGCGATGC